MPSTKKDFYVIYAEASGATFAKSLAGGMRALVPKRAKLELDIDEPTKRAARVVSPPDVDDEQAEAKRILGSNWLVVLVTPGVFECPLCIREIALGLVHKRQIVIVQNLRSSPMIWRELDRAPAPLRSAFEAAMWQRTQPVCPYLAEYADLAFTFLLELNPRLRAFTPAKQLDLPPGKDAVAPPELEKALRRIEGRVGFVYGSSGQDIATALRHTLSRAMKGNRLPRFYDLRVNDATDVQEVGGSAPKLPGIIEGTLPRISNSRGLLRTWSESFIATAKEKPKERQDPSIESSVAILFLVLSHGVLADPKALEAIEAAWAQKTPTTLVVVQDVRSTLSLSSEMKEFSVPSKIRVRLAASFSIPFVFKFGPLSVLERMVRLRVLPPFSVPSKSKRSPFARCGPDIVLTHTLSSSDWPHLLRQELQRLAPQVGCFLDIEQPRDKSFLRDIVGNAHVVGILLAPGFLSDPWASEVMENARRRNNQLIAMQPLHLAFDLEDEVEQTVFRAFPDIEEDALESDHAELDARRMQKWRQLMALMKRMPLLSFWNPGADAATVVGHFSEDPAKVDAKLCGTPSVIAFLDATNDPELARSGLCALANIAIFSGHRDAALALECNAAAQIVKSVTQFGEITDVVAEGFRSSVNFGLSNAGVDFLQQFIAEGGVQVLDEMAEKHAAKSTPVRKQLCAMQFAFGRYKETRKALEKSTWAEKVPEWVTELKVDDGKLAMLQSAVDLRDALAVAFDRPPPKGFSNALEAPNVIRKLVDAQIVFARYGEETDPDLYRRAATSEIPCIKYCGWHGMVRDHNSHECARHGMKVVPTETSTLQEAINEMKVQKVRSSILGGDDTKDARPLIWLRPGTLVESVNVDRAVRIHGDGTASECVLEGKNQSAITFVAGCANAQVENLTLRSAGTKKKDCFPHAVTVTAGTPALHNCEIRGEIDSSCGVWVEGTSQTGRLWPSLWQNVIQSCASYGVGFSQEARGTVQDNSIIGNSKGGVFVCDVAAPTLSSNKIHENNGPGVSLERTSEHSNSRATAVFEGNTITHNAGDGMVIREHARAQLRKNLIQANKGDGVLVQGFVHAEVNKVLNNDKNGFSIAATATEIEVYTNRIHSNESYGILAKPGCTGKVSHNQVFENSAGPVHSDGVKEKDLEFHDNDTEMVVGLDSPSQSRTQSPSMSRKDARGTNEEEESAE